MSSPRITAVKPLPRFEKALSKLDDRIKQETKDAINDLFKNPVPPGRRLHKLSRDNYRIICPHRPRRHTYITGHSAPSGPWGTICLFTFAANEGAASVSWLPYGCPRCNLDRPNKPTRRGRLITVAALFPRQDGQRNDQGRPEGHKDPRQNNNGNPEHQNLYPTAKVLTVSMPGVLPAA